MNKQLSIETRFMEIQRVRGKGDFQLCCFIAGTVIADDEIIWRNSERHNGRILLERS